MLKKVLSIACLACALGAAAQDIKTKDVPAAVKAALLKQFPSATKVSWEKEKGNFEANWGGKSGEDHSVQFTPAGDFAESVDAIPVSALPVSVAPYVKEHYKTAIREAGKRVDAAGSHTYEVEIKGKDLLFTTDGAFLQEEKD
ncbi:PepSY-like domain-containing protein [Dinghuibacter silviterrae]|uniref:Putative PepSY-like beta-lactamase-inhibitor n=1 Tax=Dinghuibacter silviterrae TaxID=1539049 RepID=A0A4R8DSU7_9BACT|nr:PepSY-like domain-containing protein [Dinghuibacter silviterrae]TDX01320.1 putative PepSY-like beta-lactamase-inhibitor [Dinghuibacter silviterrae]